VRSSPIGRLLAAVACAAVTATLSAQTASAPTAAPTSPGKRTPQKKAAPGEAEKQGKALFAKVLEGLGGKERVGRVRDVQTRGEVSAKTPQGDMSMEIQTAMIFPDHLSQQVDAPFGRLAMVATPAGAFIVGPNGAQDLPETMRDELLRQVERVPIFLTQKANDPRLTATAAGTEKIGEIEARILDVAYGRMTVRWFVDPKTGRILRAAHESVGLDGKPTKIVADYSDFKIVEGFPVPFHMDVTTNGEKDQVLTLEECKINPGVDAKLFEKPAPPPPPATPAP
jgi:hypothetical protein